MAVLDLEQAYTVFSHVANAYPVFLGKQYQENFTPTPGQPVFYYKFVVPIGSFNKRSFFNCRYIIQKWVGSSVLR
jgi:hypothetical protein